MNISKTILAAVAMTIAASAAAQTLKMEPQVVGVTTYEASTAVNLVVVKPEVRLTAVDPSILSVFLQRDIFKKTPRRIPDRIKNNLIV